jgi:hypothetical protein
MTGPSGDRIYVAELALKVLATVEEHFAAGGIALPDRRYVAAGNPSLVAWDCEQLVVGLSGIGWGAAPDAAPISVKPAAHMSVAGVRHAVFSIQLVRCTPAVSDVAAESGQPYPEAEEIHAAGIAFIKDAGLISQALVEMVSRLGQGLDRSGIAQAGVVNTLGPEGGHHAVEATLAITSALLA